MNDKVSLTHAVIGEDIARRLNSGLPDNFDATLAELHKQLRIAKDNCQAILAMKQTTDDENGRLESEIERLLNIARGCHDYGGGYHDQREAEIYHHGIQTVINALEAATKGDTLQLRVLESVGAKL